MLKATWNLLETANSGLFGQLICIPLFKDHKVLTPGRRTRQSHDQAAAAAERRATRIATGSKPPSTRSSPMRTKRLRRVWSLGKTLAEHAIKARMSG